jgi:hypothetical protein
MWKKIKSLWDYLFRHALEICENRCWTPYILVILGTVHFGDIGYNGFYFLGKADWMGFVGTFLDCICNLLHILQVL